MRVPAVASLDRFVRSFVRVSRGPSALLRPALARPSLARSTLGSSHGGVVIVSGLATVHAVALLGVVGRAGRCERGAEGPIA